ncbi:hypothetical protein PVAND_012783 [Polypedilum vanderplanki]|uniref:Odorant receptor n=1 Tax=Polypedilum vanderplanki TaxID=319348 RepID=A0A9J6CNG6_POLVA|nr:hypothetical protein PVAND_012783 [Polypedilum vanderplanki]
MYYTLIQKVVLFFGLDINGKYSSHPKISKFLVIWKYFLHIFLIIGVSQIWIKLIVYPTSELFNLTSWFMAFMGIQSILKVTLMNKNIHQMTSLITRISAFHINNYGALDLKNEKFMKILYKFAAGMNFFIIFSCTIAYLGYFIQMILEYFNGTSSDMEFPFQLFWPFSESDYRIFIMIYIMFLHILANYGVFANNHIMTYTVAFLAICFDRLAGEVKEIINESDKRSFQNTKRILAEYVDKHNQLIEFRKNLNSLYGITVLTFTVQSSAVICMMGFIILTRSFSEALSCTIGIIVTIVQVIVIFYAGDKLKENSRKISETIGNSDIEKVDQLLKKNILLIIQVSNQPKKLSAMNFFSVDLETCATVSISYLKQC